MGAVRYANCKTQSDGLIPIEQPDIFLPVTPTFCFGTHQAVTFLLITFQQLRHPLCSLGPELADRFPELITTRTCFAQSPNRLAHLGLD